MPTQSAAQALKILRDGSQFQWYIIPPTTVSAILAVDVVSLILFGAVLGWI